VRALSRKIDRLETTFDHDGLVANAGLIVPATLMTRLGVEALINRWVKTGSSRPGRKVLTLVTAMIAGGTHIDHVNVLRAGATQTVLPFRVMAPSAAKLRPGGRARPVGGSGCCSVLVDESRTSLATADRCGGFDLGLVGFVVGCSLAEAAVGPAGVVVRYEFFEESAKLALVPDQRPVEQFMAHGTDPSLSERVRLRCTVWDGVDRAADRREHIIEGACVLASAVADHEPDGLVVAHQEVPGGLGGPAPGGVGGDPGEVHPSGVELDEEQHVETAQRDGIDAEEVSSDQGVGLAGDELAPGRPCAIGRGFTSRISEDLPHRRPYRSRVCFRAREIRPVSPAWSWWLWRVQTVWALWSIITRW